MVYSSAQPFSSMAVHGSGGAAPTTSGSGAASAAVVPPSRPSTPVVGPQSFGGTSSSASSFLSSAKAKLAALTVALPTLAEAEEPGNNDADARGGGGFGVFALPPGSPSALARSVTTDVGGVNASVATGRAAPAPSPAVTMLASGGEAAALGHVGVFGSGSFGGAAPSFGADFAETTVPTALPSSSRPPSPLLFGSSRAGAGAPSSLVLPHLNREDVVAPAAAFGGVGIGSGGEDDVKYGGAVPVPAVVTVTSAGVVTETKVAAADGTATTGGAAAVPSSDPFVLSAGSFNPFAAATGTTAPAAAVGDAGADALDTIAEQDAARDASVAASFGVVMASASPFGQPLSQPTLPGPGSYVPFGTTVVGGFVSNDALSSRHHQQSPQRPIQLPPWQPQAQQQPHGPTPQQALMLQRFAAQQQQARAAMAARQQQQHQQQQVAVARLLFTQQQQAQVQHQQRMASVPRATAAPQSAAVAVDEALVPACNGRCRPPLAPRNGGLNVLALTRAGSIACAYCGQRAYSKVATVDTDPYALTSGSSGNGGGGAGGRTPTLPSLSSPPRAPTSFGGAAPVVVVGLSSSGGGGVSSHRPVSSYGAVRRAPRHSKPHHRRTSSSSSSTGLSPDTAAGSDENHDVGVSVSSMQRNPNYNPYLSDDLDAASCSGVGEGVTYASLKSRRNARRGSAGGGSGFGGFAGGPSLLPRARVVLNTSRSTATSAAAGGRA